MKLHTRRGSRRIITSTRGSLQELKLYFMTEFYSSYNISLVLWTEEVLVLLSVISFRDPKFYFSSFSIKEIEYYFYAENEVLTFSSNLLYTHLNTLLCSLIPFLYISKVKKK
jgi:hypothetical protein